MLRNCAVIVPILAMIGSGAGCLQGPTAGTPSPGGSIEPDPAAPAVDPLGVTSPEQSPQAPTPKEHAFIVHEWGTYTSTQGSDGGTLGGMHHADEPLPAFVGRRDIGCAPDQKCMEPLPEAVTQKLETPVIYFYSDEVRDAEVTVDFPAGIISEHFPQPEAHAPPLGDVRAIANGSMSWQVRVDPSVDPSRFPAVHPDDIWAPSRRTAATPIVSSPPHTGIPDEHERFIFYRGVGRFERPVRVTTDSEGFATVRNAGGEALPAVFYLDVRADSGSVVALGALGAQTSLVVRKQLQEPLAHFVVDAKAQVRDALVASGLYEDEAQAMVDTWERSYFMTPGPRVLYVAPRSWTDELLPITITPAPDALVRTLVGRIEVLTPASEAAFLTRVSAMATAIAAGEDTVWACWERLEADEDRLLEARLRRARALAADPIVRDFVDGVIARLDGIDR